MNPDKIMILYKGVFVTDCKYATNDTIFYYNVLTHGGDSLVYKYSNKEHNEIQFLKFEQYWNDYCQQ